ncbi:DNA-binding response regulator, NarL/FixJ family, contains REC and HTH domains [Flavobacteriaceae bacterium MAR_2010_188]|nr:DNA-binding response regulator, NarL/FixJ family, contains REC and HTH domains [Flavobacteriaceae bacterium MAR_2010_188]
MFQKVLVSDDLVSINYGVFSVLNNLNIQDQHQVNYLDDAYLKIKKAANDNKPYDLLISDLSFKKDHREQRFENGEDLIKVLREEHPNLPIIVYSVEDRFPKIRRLINDFGVGAYVCKGRKGLAEMEEAVKAVYQKELFLSPQISSALNPNHFEEINDFDIHLLTQLSLGLSQDEISLHFKENGISPSSLSSIEKRLNKLRIQFKANNAIHLISIVKDLGLI